MHTEFSEFLKHKIIGSFLYSIAKKYLHFKAYCKIIKKPHLSNIYLEDIRIEQILKSLITDSMNCVDIGCHLGFILEEFKSLSPNGKHIAIEPIPYKADWLKNKYPNFTIHQIALSDFEGQVPFYFYPKLSGFSGLSNNPTKNEHEKFDVICKKLDDVLPKELRIDFIKIDVEGAELKVFQGGKQTLEKYKPVILFECAQSGLNAFNVTAEEIFTFLEELDYQIFLLQGWLHNHPALTISCFKMSMKYPFLGFNFLAVHKDKVSNK